MKEHLVYFLKGLGMGIANIIPGVSGGTIALITGIFERMIDALKSFDLVALKLFFAGKWKSFARHTDLYFLLAVFSGAVLAIVLLAKVFAYLFDQYPVYIWSFFFGLILASVYFVGKTVERWRFTVYLFFLMGTLIALMFTFLTPATENNNFWYLILCGVVAVCSMILPGLSGSFVLILMGNYQLVAIDAINNRDLAVLFPVFIGAVLGLISFSHLLSWVFKKFRDQTIAALTGFILGSLGIIWPWKDPLEQTFGNKVKVVGYDFFLPHLNVEFVVAMVIMIAGVAAIWWMESSASMLDESKSEQ